MRRSMPIDINNLTIREFITYNKCLRRSDPDFALMREFLGLTQDQIDEMPFRKLNLIKTQIGWLRSSVLKRRRRRIVRVGWRFRFAFRDFNSNQFTALDTYTFPDQAHLIAAVGYGFGNFDENDVEKWAERFMDVKIGKVSGQVFFCTQISPLSNLNLNLYSLESRMTIKTHLMEISEHMKVSDEIMDGII
jgi:hypothetical protein